MLMHSVTFSYYYPKCHYDECHYTECRYAKCHYAECLGAFLDRAITITLVWTVRLASEAIASAFIVCALAVPQQETELRNCESEELAIFKGHAAIKASVVAGCRKDGDLESFV